MNSLRLITGPDAQRTTDELKGQGLLLVNEPSHASPVLPSDITAICDEDLMALFADLTEWSDFVSTQATLAAIDEKAAQRALDRAEASALQDNWKGGSGERLAVAKAAAALDPNVQDAIETLSTRHAYRSLIETMRANLDRDAGLVSRELTRRTANNPVAGRKSRYIT